MNGQEITLAGLAQQMQQLMAFNVHLQQQLSNLMSAGGSANPVESAHDSGSVDGPTKAAESAPAAPAVHSPLTPSFKSLPQAEVVHMKVATPDPFNGNLAKSEEFLNSLLLYFMGKPGMTDEQKITFALSYMKGGTAGQWSKRMLKQYAKDERAPSWESFHAEFMHTFSDPDPKGTARHKLSKLKQGTNSADEYVASFKELMDETGYNDDALEEMFERGLSKSLVDRIYTLPELPGTLEDWMSQAMKFDRLQRRREEKYRHGASSFTATSNHPKPSPQSTNPPKQTVPSVRPPNSSDGVVPMEVDSSRKKSGPKGVCFKCMECPLLILLL